MFIRALVPLRHIALLFLFGFLTACGDSRNDFYNWAISLEREAADLQSLTLEASGFQVAILRNPPALDRKTLVMIHGFGANKDNWVRMASHLKDSYNLVMLDLPGHGESSKPMDRTYGLEDQVAYVDTVLVKLGIGKAILSGNSMGGAISALYAARHPDKVEALVLFDPAGIHDVESEFSKALKAGHNPLIARNAEEFEDLIDFAMEQPPFLPWPITEVLAERSVADQAIKEHIFDNLRNPATPLDFKAALSQIQAPTLVVWGEQDRVIAVGNAEPFAALIPKGSTRILADIGHVPMLEDPSGSAELTNRFIQEHSKL